MPRRRVSMRKIRELVRLHEECGLTNRQIAKALNISRPVVGGYLTNLKRCGLRYEDIKTMDDTKLLEAVQTKRKKTSERYRTLSDKFPYFVKELKKRGVTLYLLWEEYKAENPKGYGYSQFCYHFQVWRGLFPVSMHIEHKAGEGMFADFTGEKIKVQDEKMEVFVAILGASQLTYAQATQTQRKEDWIRANENALWYFGGVPKIIVPDCLKSAVTRADKYEPEVNPVYHDFARHYGTVIVPARPHAPKDKALVENAVKIVYQRVFAPLRNKNFYSLEELNRAIREKIDDHNSTSFQRMRMSRRQLFNEVEKDALRELPSTRYELKEFRRYKVASSYHIGIPEDNHYYSVPWQYRGKYITLVYTDKMVQVYHHNVRIASYPRVKKRGYTTCREHMPEEHRFFAELTPEKITARAKIIGDEVKELVERILQEKESRHQGIRVSLGIIDLSRRYDNERLNAACKRASEFHLLSYRGVKNILERGLDGVREDTFSVRMLPVHKNIRGGEYFT